MTGRRDGDRLRARFWWLFACACTVGRLRAWGRRLRGGPAVRSILVQRRARLGDVVVILPMLRELRARFPQARLVLGVDAGSPAAELLAGAGLVDEVRVLEDPAARRSPLARVGELLRLLHEGFDVLISGEQFSLIVPSYYCGAPLRVGLDDGGPLRRANNRRVPLDPTRHAADNHLALVERLTGRPAETHRAPRLPLPASATDLPAALAAVPFVVLHAGAQKPSRRWPAERFGELARRLLEAHPELRVAWTGLALEGSLVDTALAALPEPLRARCVELTGKTGLDGLAGVLRAARAVVVNDTGVMHLARAAGASLVALLGPENDAYWGPHPAGWGPAISLRHGVPCAPCTRWDCDVQVCLRSLTVDEVFDAVSKRLAAGAGADAVAPGRGRHDDGAESALETRHRREGWADLAAAGLVLPTLSAPPFDAASARWLLGDDVLGGLRVAAPDPGAAGEPWLGAMSPAPAPASGQSPPAAAGAALAAAPGDLVLVATPEAGPPELGAAFATLLRRPDLDAVRAGPGATLVRRARLEEALQAAEEAPQERLPPVAAQLAGLARDLWAARELLAQITLRDIRIRYSQAVMGFGWAVLMPVMIVGAGVLIRYAMAYVSKSQVQAPEILGMAVKAIPWAFFVGALGFATTSLTGNYQLVTKVAFPRIVLPISAVLTQAFDTAIGCLALVLLLPLLGGRPSAAWLWALPLAGLAFLLTTAASVFVSCANLFFRDVKYLVQVFLTFGIFFTPIFFEPVMLGETGGLLLMLNPLSPVLEGLRLCITQGHDLAQTLRVVDAQGVSVVAWTPWYLVYATAVTVLGCVGSALLFRRLEHVFAEYV